MKKTLVACLAVAALFAMVGSANAITCTTDQRPAATLLIPYFQATFNADGTIDTSSSSLDTLVTIGNASAAPMLAHVSVFTERSEFVLDFNIALTGFDIQSFSMASILRGFLPSTPVDSSHKSPPNSITSSDVCQRNASAKVYPNSAGFLRLAPGSIGAPATGLDNTLATAAYGPGPFSSSFLFGILDSLDTTGDSVTCGGVDGVITNPIHGYLTIDHANYCNLSNPSDPAYYTNDAMGMENNLWGDYIFTSAAGVGTMGFPAVAIEADPSLADATAAPTTLGGAPGRRTFYRRYVIVADAALCAAGNTAGFTAAGTTFDCGNGDQREPLGLKYASRWFDSAPNVTSFFNIWRASSVPSTTSGGLADLLGDPVGKCNTTEEPVTLTFYDEDENTVLSGTCPSPCSAPSFNYPLETQRVGIVGQPHPAWPAGWVSMEFFNAAGPVGGALDQAYVTYDFQGASAFLSAGSPAAQLDPTACQPLLVPATVTVTNPVIPALVGTGP